MLRSFDPLSDKDIELIVGSTAERLGINLDPKLCSLIAEYTIEGRQAVRLLADAYSAALFRHCEKMQIKPISRSPKPICCR